MGEKEVHIIIIIIIGLILISNFILIRNNQNHQHYAGATLVKRKSVEKREKLKSESTGAIICNMSLHSAPNFEAASTDNEKVFQLIIKRRMEIRQRSKQEEFDRRKVEITFPLPFGENDNMTKPHFFCYSVKVTI